MARSRKKLRESSQDTQDVIQILDLPAELLLHILQYLSENEIFWNISFVCQRLRAIAVPKVNVIEICKGPVSDLTANFKRLLKNEEIVLLIRHIMICSDFDDKLKLELIKRETKFCRPFKLLVLDYTLLNNATSCWFASSFPNLESLIMPNYRGLSKITSRGFKNILESCRGLKDIDLRDSDYDFGGTNNIVNIIAKSSKELEYININRCNPNDYSLMCLFRNCTNLKIVCLKCCSQLSDTSLSTLTYFCKELLSLNLDQCTRISDKPIIEIAKTFPKLVELSLRNCNVTDHSIKVVGQHSYKLKVLNLRKCHISDNSIEIVGRNCKYIENLDLSMSNGTLSNKSIKVIAKNCLKLKRVHLTYWNNAAWKHRGSENCLHCIHLIRQAAIMNTADIGIELSKFCLDGFIFTSNSSKPFYYNECFAHN